MRGRMRERTTAYVSSPLFTPSEQVGAAHWFAVHTPLAQSAGALHSTHAPLSPHSPAPASHEQSIPAMTSCVIALPLPSHMGTVHVPSACPGAASAVAAATPHSFAAQMAVWHGLAGAGPEVRTY